MKELQEKIEDMMLKGITEEKDVTKRMLLVSEYREFIQACLMKVSIIKEESSSTDT